MRAPLAQGAMIGLCRRAPLHIHGCTSVLSLPEHMLHCVTYLPRLPYTSVPQLSKDNYISKASIRGSKGTRAAKCSANDRVKREILICCGLHESR